MAPTAVWVAVGLTACGANLGVGWVGGDHIAPGVLPVSPPASVLVVAFPDPPEPPTPDPSATRRDTTQALQHAVIRLLAKDGVPAAPRHAQAMAADALVLQCALTEIRRGDGVGRLAVGLGVGQSQLVVDSRLYDVRVSPPAMLLHFSTDASSGIRPGVALSVGLGAATADFVQLAGAGVGTAEILSAGPTVDLNHTSRAIVTELETYFRRRGWRIWAARADSVMRYSDPTGLPPPRPMTRDVQAGNTVPASLR